jgi:hypothetical protein
VTLGVRSWVGASAAAILVACITMSGAAGGATTKKAASSHIPQPSVSVAYLRHGLGIVGMVNTRTPDRSQLELTTDFVHWRNITPPGLKPDRYGDVYVFESVSFPTALDGWVTANRAGTLYMFRTINGGRTWTIEGPSKGSDQGGAAGYEMVTFDNAEQGWREIVAPTAGQVVLSESNNGGRTWQRSQTPSRWPSAGFPVATGNGRALDADTLPPSDVLPTTGNGFGNFSGLWLTTDQGGSWVAPVVPVSAAAGTSVDQPGLPTVVGQGHLVEPVLVVSGTTSSVEFFGSDDGGVSWTYESSVATEAQLRPGVPWSRSASLLATTDGLFPSVTVAGTGTWWVASGAGQGNAAVPTVSVTTDEGRTWKTEHARGLPEMISSMQAANANTAWATYESAPGCGLVGTTDAGATWQKVCPGSK